MSMAFSRGKCRFAPLSRLICPRSHELNLESSVQKVLGGFIFPRMRQYNDDMYEVRYDWPNDQSRF